MKRNRHHISNRIVHLIVVTVMAAMFVSPMASWGQNVASEAGSHEIARPNTDNQALLDQITELQAEVAKLRAAMQQTDPVKRSRAGSRMKMGGGKAMVVMDDMGEMGGMGSGQNRGMSQGSGGGIGKMGDQGEMGGMSPGGKLSGAGGGMGMMDEGEMGGMSSGGGMGMCCMGEMGGMTGGTGQPDRGMGGMKVSPSTMPGQPGASHLYHIGSTGFFLDHAKHIALTPEQKKTLNRLKERALLGRTAQQRRIDQAEQELYMLTGADQPDTTQIQAKIAEIEKLRSDQRMNFIRAVGEAANVLTHDQHRTLLGTMTSNQK
jgi:Spy/CpxP family protein refolding chaperone